MIKGNIQQDRDTNNLISMKKERDLFSYLVGDVLYNPGNGPISTQNKACSIH
jgi:hypothetical protein